MGRTTSVPPPSDGRGAPDGSYDGALASVFGLARQVTGDSGVAASLTADTFAALHQLGPNPSATLETCLVTDVHRRAVQWARDERITHGADATAMARAAPLLADLAEDERAVIVDAYFGGCTYAEIAERHGLDPADVAVLMQRGLRHLASRR